MEEGFVSIRKSNIQIGASDVIFYIRYKDKKEFKKFEDILGSLKKPSSFIFSSRILVDIELHSDPKYKDFLMIICSYNGKRLFLNSDNIDSEKDIKSDIENFLEEFN